MFKTAFQRASLTEEEAERQSQKPFPSAGPDEVAGGVSTFSEDYGMRRWIVALLDPSPIQKGSKDRNNTHIKLPPRFDVDQFNAPVVLPRSRLRRFSCC
jgi:hypothetical protein